MSAWAGPAFQSSLTYQLDLTTLPDQATTITAKLKAGGIGYCPEWVITGTVLTLTTTLGRD